MKNRKRFTLPSAAALLAILLLTTGSAETSYAQAGAETDIRLPEFIAHRGASWLAPENTMASIQLAWEMDVDAVEIDIYLTADDQIVLFHDRDRKSTRLNSSHVAISYAVFCLKKKTEGTERA